ncbi:hypothetical protein PCE1_002606 [Barthelona sp. PCE]
MKLLFCIIAFLLILATSKRITMRNGRFYDHLNRDIVFRGVNVVQKNPPYYPDYKTKQWSASMSLNEHDFLFMQQQGITVIRLGIIWSGVEPSPGHIDYKYLDNIKNIVDLAGNYGIYSIIDLHQDLLTDQMCGEGCKWLAPFVNVNVTSFPEPRFPRFERNDDGLIPKEICLKHMFGDYYMSFAQSELWQALYDNINNIQEHFVNMWTAVVKHLRNCDYTLGYEIINEPFIGDIFNKPHLLKPGAADHENLMPLYKKVARAVYRIDPDAILFLEPVAADILPSGFLVDDLPWDRIAYSFHVYCTVAINDKGIPINDAKCALQELEAFSIHQNDIKKLGSGQFLTEFGAVWDDPASLRDMERVMNGADAMLVSTAYWSYKSLNDPTTASGYLGAYEGLWYIDDVQGKYSFQQCKSDVLFRPHAHAASGNITSMVTDVRKGHSMIKFTSKGGDFIFKVGNKIDLLVNSHMACSVTKFNQFEVILECPPSNSGEFFIELQWTPLDCNFG